MSAPLPHDAVPLAAGERLLRLPRWLRLTLLAVGSRLLALVSMVLGTFWPHPPDELHWVGRQGDFYWNQVPYRLLDVWGRWDTFFYWHIAREGYPAARVDGGWVYHAAFFPLFPALMRGLSRVLFGLDTYLCGVGLAFGFFALALVYLDKLVRLDRSPRFAELVVLVLCAYPGSHFLTCVYPESLTLFLGVFAVYNARQGRAGVAGLACMLAAVARSSGLFITAAVALELLRRDGRWRLSPWLGVLALPVLAEGAWLALNASLYGDPLYFVHVQAGWGRHPSFFLAPLFSLELTLDYHLLTVGLLALTWYGWLRRERPSLLALASLNALLPLSTGMMRGIHRYVSSDFPLFIFLARLLEPRRRALWAYVLVGAGAMAHYAFMWGAGRHPN